MTHTTDSAEALAEALAARMSLGTSGRWIAEYGETPETLAQALIASGAVRCDAEVRAEALREAYRRIEVAASETAQSVGRERGSRVAGLEQALFVVRAALAEEGDQ